MVVRSANICALHMVLARSTTCSAVSNPIRGTMYVRLLLLCCTGWGTAVGRSPALGGKRVQKIRYVLTENRNRTEGLWKVRKQKRRENKGTWKHQNFRFNVELISVQSVEN
jgi:hypothetical protein